MLIKIDLYDYNVTLNLNNRLTLIRGDSGVGKTLIYNWFYDQGCKDSKIYCFDSVSLFHNTDNKDNVFEKFYEDIRCLNNKIIVIDNADSILNKNIRNFISMKNKNNTYILFGRNPSNLMIRNNIANLIRDDKEKKIYLDYYVNRHLNTNNYNNYKFKNSIIEESYNDYMKSIGIQ